MQFEGMKFTDIVRWILSQLDNINNLSSSASNKANEASASAQLASNKADVSVTAAQTATTKANEASASAQTASDKANVSVNAAQTATTKASEAGDSAAAAAQSLQTLILTINQMLAIDDAAPSASSTYSSTKIEQMHSQIMSILSSDDINLDTLQEVINAIKSDEGLITALTTAKVNVNDIVDALNSAATNKPLSAAQGKVLKDILDTKAASAHSHHINEITDFPTFKTINGNNIIGTGDIAISSSSQIETTSSPVFGLLYNVTDDLYKRIGKNINSLTIDGFNEFSAWRSPTAERQNDADTASPSPLTAWLDSTANLPYSGIGRYVIDNTGAVIKKYNADSYTHADQTDITTTQQVMCPIPLHQYISARIVDGGKTYFLYMVAKNAFTVNAITDLGFVSPTITVWNPTTGVSSGTVAANNIASATSLAHVATSGILPTAAYGAFNAVNGRSICGSGVKATGNITRAQARTQCQAFGANFNQIDFFLESTKNILVLIERGSFYMERGGASMANKWEGYSWNSSGSSNNQDNGKTLALLDRTGVILDGSNRTIANSWRGIENYHSALWRWVDGVNLASNVVYLAKRRAAFDDTSTTTNGYFSSDYTVPSGASASYISDLGAGTFIPTAVSGASATTKVTDGAWTGSTALSVGGALSYPSTSGVCAWNSNNAASYSGWTIVARPGL